MRNRQSTNFTALLLVIIGITGLVAVAARSPVAVRPPESNSLISVGDDSAVAQINRVFVQRWQSTKIEPAKRADDLTVLRRLSLVLHGTIPSLEEIRLFEADDAADRIARWTARLLADRRYADYFARRLSRVFVGADQGQFVVFRRDRFWTWMGDQLHRDRAYDEIVRDMMSNRGLWTDKPEVNFVAAAVNEGVIDRNKLAARTVRAFLGQRMDCAQCHNHPFADWKQDQFAGVAACFGQVSLSVVGVEDNQKKPFSVQDRMTLADKVVAPSVPFHAEWMPESGSSRERLAEWVTHADNRRFDRAIVNRVWGLMFGRPWIQPVDDLPNPNEAGDPDDVLDILAADFREHGRRLKPLIATIAATQIFQLSTQHASFESGKGADEVEQNWAVFPLTRLRPEQVIGSMLQASSLKTLDQDSHWTQRAVRFFRELDFVRDYGDLGEDELTERSGTIPQALLRMNSKFAAEWTKGTIFSAAGRISGMANDDDACLDLCFLVCLTRHPSLAERDALRSSLQHSKRRERTSAVEDLFWSLFNGPEFCWEH